MGPAAEIRYSVLGPVRAWRGDEELDLGQPKQRAVLAVLLLNANRPVTRNLIVDAVWGEETPASGVNLVHTYVSRLRHVLDPGRGQREPSAVLAGSPAGYLLRLAAGQLDLLTFYDLLGQARARRADGDLAGAASAYAAGLALWHGTPLAGIPGPLADAERGRLSELRVATAESKAEVMLELGRHGDLVAELSALVGEHPLRERIWALLMTALYRSGRQAEALAAFARVRTLLTDELGIDPGPELRGLHQQILTGDPALMATGGTGLQVPRQLPPGPAHFVGRAGPLRELTRLVGMPAGETGTVVISAINGTAGIGKTALAVHWAHQVADQFPDGQLYVNLRGFDPEGTPVHPADALRGFLDAFGVPPERVPVTLDAKAAMYRSLLAGRRMLVVLDNARDTGQVRPLLPASPECLVVITSRNRLASLVTAEGAHQLTLDLLSGEDAIALLARRLGARRVAAEPHTARELIESCGRLPLALAIVAARAAAQVGFPLAALAAELRDVPGRLDALDAGEPRASLRAVLSLSADALDPPAAATFGLLGLAPGPDFGLPAAACLTGQPVSRCRAPLRELENAHLLQQHAPGRYRMHDLVRQYAAEHAQQGHPLAAREAALARLTDFYLHTAHIGDRLLAPHRPPLPGLGPPEPGCAPLPLADENRAWTWFSSEHPCLLATQRLAADRGWHTKVWQLAWALTTFHRRQGRLADQVAAWQAGLAATRSLGDPAAQILAHRYLAEACSLAGDHEGALLHHHRALSLAEDTEDVPGQALTHSALTGAWERRGDDRRALDHANRAMLIFRALGDRVQEARSLGDVGWYHARLGNYEPARAHCNAALMLHRQHHDREAEAAILDTLGYIAQHSGGHGQAADYYQQAAARFSELGDNYQEAEILERLAEVQETLGQRDQAHSTWKQALDLYLAHRRDADAERLQRRLAALGTAGRA